MEIRQIELDDLPSIYRLGQEAFLKEKDKESFVYSYWSLKQIAEMYENYPEFSLVAVDSESGKIAGFVLGHPTYEEIVAVGYLEWIAVNPEFRGQGISTKLVENLLKIYAQKGKRRIVTDVKGINEISMNLFAKFGFVVKESVSFLVKDM